LPRRARDCKMYIYSLLVKRLQAKRKREEEEVLRERK
jgi:hypothetical protein